MYTKWKYEKILLRNVCENVMLTTNNQDIVNKNFIALAKRDDIAVKLSLDMPE